VVSGGRGEALRHLADVAGAFVHALQKGIETRAECVVTFGAAHPPDLLELMGGKATGWAGGVCISRMTAAGGADECLSKPKTHVIGDAFVLRALFAQIYRGHLAIDDLSQKYGGFRLANVTLHGLGTLSRWFSSINTPLPQGTAWLV